MIIFNVPESDDNTSANDSSVIKSIFDSLSIVMTPTAINRLGRKSTKPRPLKISLQDASDVFVILKNKHKLRSTPNYCSIRISPDRTQMQRDQLRNVYAKLEERKAAGETDLIVKFLKGIPTISKN
ncbi:unnamed protein product [Macrosiphum euphorbiae]|uniref:Uncharacterized protein n=1 Tax=Macrosiphum euphorbiae TaxID=13131 RepID=A0AAV0XNH7_9HEMI|nr:unnamed protein product [Macrosiphum euphorbiae]